MYFGKFLSRLEDLPEFFVMAFQDLKKLSTGRATRSDKRANDNDNDNDVD